MANELTITCGLTASKGFLYQSQEPGSIRADMAGTAVASNVQNIGTTAEALAMTDVATAGYAFFRNTSASIAVELGTGTAGSFVAFAKLKAGETAVLRLGTNAPTARAASTTVDLQYFIVAD